MKNKQLLLLVTAMIAVPLYADVLPYLPVKVNIGEEIKKEDFKTLNFESDFTLEFEASQGDIVKFCNSTFNGIDYEVKHNGKYRIENKAGILYIYCNNKYLEQRSIYNIEYPLIYDLEDNKEAQEGIYSPLNLFKNPGFEDIVDGGKEEKNRYIPAAWESENFYTSTNSRVNTDYGDKLTGIEGRGALMHHGYSAGNGMFFYQKIDNEKLENNSKYLVCFRTWSHSNAYGKYTAKVGYEVNSANLIEYSWTQTSTAYNCNDLTFEFTYLEKDDNKDLYFTIIRNGETIGHFDRMLMVKRRSDAPEVSGLYSENITNVKFDESGAYAPVMDVLEDDYYDMTSFINDATVSKASAWSGSTVKIESGKAYSGAPDGSYLNMWSGSVFTYDIYQNISDLPSGVYTLTAVARSNDSEFYVYSESDSNENKVSIPNNVENDTELGLGWERVKIENIIVKNGLLKIGASGTASKGNVWLSVDDFHLYYHGVDVSILKETLLELIEDSKKFDLSSVPTGIANELTDAIKIAEEVSNNEEAIRLAEENLLEKFTTANSYVVFYADLNNSIKSFSYLNNEWFTDIINDAQIVYSQESPTLEEIKDAQNNLLDNIIKIMDKFSGYNYTGQISNPDINSENGWIFENKNGSHKTISGEHYTYDDLNRYLDSWNGTPGALDYNAYQNITNLKNGLYILSAAARASGNGAFIYANDMKREIFNNGSSDGELDKGWNIVRVPVVVTDGNLKIGVRTMVDMWTGTWLSADDFTLINYPYDNNYLSIEDAEKEDIRIYTLARKIYVEGISDYEIINVSGMKLPKNSEFEKGVYYIITENRSFSIFVN